MAADPESLTAALESRARRLETPCGDGTMVWRVWGEGEPLVVSHGSQGTWSHWIANIDVLARERMVIAPDLPGHGDSAMPQPEDFTGIAAALALGLREILGGQPADLAGFSFGGIAFGHLTANHPELVRRLILIATGGLGTPLGDIRLGRVGGLRGEERKAALKGNLLGLMLRDPERADDLAQHLLLANARLSRLSVIPLMDDDPLLRVLPAIRVPLGAIWGGLDLPHPDPDLQESVLREHHPEVDFRVVPDAGHWVMYERPDAFNATLQAMLRDLPLP